MVKIKEFVKHTYEKGFVNDNEFKRLKNALDNALGKVAKYQETSEVSSIIYSLYYRHPSPHNN